MGVYSQSLLSLGRDPLNLVMYYLFGTRVVVKIPLVLKIGFGQPFFWGGGFGGRGARGEFKGPPQTISKLN